MTGYDIYKKVCSILGYFDSHQEQVSVKSEAVTDMINQICDDLKLPTIENLSGEVSSDKKAVEALIYGVAMILSTSLKDSGCSALYSELYNSKRAAALSCLDTRTDVLPSTQGGM